ncbi:related to integral membrane protein pth11 [Cephalotrichum gorgonifer]|uniref:Related to integral membrane protein pth11 n=1 Tax=Cephalotrichum gorgonifer TaxID=2041049 RepID=A0AAE8SYX6_9PEZI|nr:related to integral membrane protein pth11 [Cephalotrichum gorgonifer]
MSSYGGRGPTVNAALWTEAVIAALFIFARMYTRIFILHSAGWDDFLLCVTLVCTSLEFERNEQSKRTVANTLHAKVLFAVYAAFISAGTAYGLGQRRADIPPEDYIQAMKFEIIGQGVCIFNIATSKGAVAAFLLRIVRRRWHCLFIWAVVVSTCLIVTWCTIAIFIQCTPVEKVWNFEVPGKCWLDFSTIGLATSAYAVAVDFILALAPAFILWDLNMKRKDKFLAIFGLALGVFAGVCGILRTTALTTLRSYNEYIFDTVDMLIYSGTENFVSIICASIPVLRPLWVKARGYDSTADESYKRSYQLSGMNSQDPTRALEIGDQGRSATRIFASQKDRNGDNDTGSEEIILQSSNGKVDEAQVHCQTDISVSYSSRSEGRDWPGQ